MLGKGAIILVMGAAAILSMLILNLNANATSGVETTVDFYKQTQARLIANSGVEIYLEKLRRDKNLKEPLMIMIFWRENIIYLFMDLIPL